MKQVTVKISPTGFPSQFVSDSEKKTDEFGLQIGQAIQYEWFKKDGTNCRFYSQWAEFNRLRLYARGEQSIAKYKNEISVDGDLSYINLDWTPVPILPKFVDIVVNGMSQRTYDVKTMAQDPESRKQRTDYAQKLYQDIMLEKYYEAVEQMFPSMDLRNFEKTQQTPNLD